MDLFLSISCVCIPSIRSLTALPRAAESNMSEPHYPITLHLLQLSSRRWQWLKTFAFLLIDRQEHSDMHIQVM